MSIPDTLRPIIGRWEYGKALRAVSEADAVKKARPFIARWDAEIEAAKAQAKAARDQAAPPRRGQSLSLQQLARDHYQARIQADAAWRNFDSRYAAHWLLDTDYVARLRDVVAGRTCRPSALVG